MSPVRHIPSARPIDLTKADERLSGVWRYSSHVSLVLGGGALGVRIRWGYEDVAAQSPIIEKFFEKLERRPDKTVV